MVLGCTQHCNKADAQANYGKRYVIYKTRNAWQRLACSPSSIAVSPPSLLANIVKLTEADLCPVQVQRYRNEPRNIWDYWTEVNHTFIQCSYVIATVNRHIWMAIFQFLWKFSAKNEDAVNQCSLFAIQINC